MQPIRYSYSPTGGGRRHFLTGADIDIVLSRLPENVYERLRAVHFNDRSRGARVAGYVNMGYREIAICAMPARVSLSRYLVHTSATKYKHPCPPREFGAVAGHQWPELAIRRFMLYVVFLHELGHLQIIDPRAQRPKRMFAGETKAQEFANLWRVRLWSASFPHPDPVHNRPAATEFTDLAKSQCVRSDAQ